MFRSFYQNTSSHFKCFNSENLHELKQADFQNMLDLKAMATEFQPNCPVTPIPEFVFYMTRNERRRRRRRRKRGGVKKLSCWLYRAAATPQHKVEKVGEVCNTHSTNLYMLCNIMHQ